MTATSDLLERLRRHYIKPGAPLPGGVFVPEVGLNNGHSRQRRCDAVYVGFTATSGQRLVGHELKVSRADWRHELDDPTKSETWASQCHAWYVVAPSTDVVPVEEVPDAWGLMVPNPRSKTRMDIVRRAPVKPDGHVPDWLIVRSILARLDTLQARERSGMRAEEQGIARQEYAARLEQHRATLTPTGTADTELVDRLEAATGLQFRASYRSELGATPDQLAQALALLKTRDRLIGYRGLTGTAERLTAAVEQLRVLDAHLNELVPTAKESRP